MRSATITSAANPKVRYARRLARRSFRARERRVVLEGARLVAEAAAAGAAFDFALFTPDWAASPDGERLLDSLTARGIAAVSVTDAVLQAAADTVTPQGVLAVAAAPDVPWPERVAALLVLDGLGDPGNVGTVLRTALAAGADGVLLAPGTADATNAKVLRAGAGAQFRLPVRAARWAEIEATAARHALSVWVADAAGEEAYDRVDWTAGHALVIGAEASGPSAAARQLGRTVRIPMPGPAESLNAAVAAAVLLFEGARQRRRADPRT